MTPDQLTASARSLIEGFRDGSLSPIDIAEQQLGQIDAVNPVINALIAVDSERIRRDAAASARRWRAGTPVGALDGVPITLKDSVNAIGMPWRHGALGNDGLPDANFDAPPAARLKESGAVVLGKTTMPDFGMAAAGVSSLYGITRNPWDLSRNTGGSSAGAAAALASGISALAVGSDIAGSVRLPASHCGLAALKPTQGRVPHLPASTVRSAGPMARSIEDVELMFEVLSQPDPRDILSLPADGTGRLPDPSFAALEIAVLSDMGYGLPVEPAVQRVLEAAVTAISLLGADPVLLDPLFAETPYPALDRLFQAKALAELDAMRAAGRGAISAEIVAWCEQAAGYGAAGYVNDLAAVDASTRHVTDTLSPYDLVISPVMPVVGFAAEALGPEGPRVSHLEHGSFTAWFNQTGQPAATIPFGFDELGRPIGVQIVGRRFSDRLVLAAARVLERSAERRAWPVRPLVSAAA